MNDTQTKPKKNYTNRRYATINEKQVLLQEISYRNIPGVGSITYEYYKNFGWLTTEVFTLVTGDGVYKTERGGYADEDEDKGVQGESYKDSYEESHKDGKKHGVFKDYDDKSGELKSEVIWFEDKSYTPAEFVFAMYQTNMPLTVKEPVDPTPAVTAKIKYIDQAPKAKKKEKAVQVS